MYPGYRRDGRAWDVGRMKTRIVEPEPEPVQPRHNVAARMAHWSSRHRKKAILGWLAFVVVAFAAGNMIGSTNISDVDQFSGESGRAEKALDRAGLRPVEEVVLVQSDGLTVKDPAFRAAVKDVTAGVSGVKYVKNVTSPLAGDGKVSADGHAAIVGFEIAGDSTQAADRVDPAIAAVAAAQADQPALDIEQFGGASANKAIDEVIGEDLKQAGLL